ITSPQIVLDIDRDEASALGVTADQIESALGAAYGSKQVSTIYTPTNQYWVILEVDPQYQLDPTALEQRPAGAARRGRDADTRPRAARREPPGPAPGGDDLVQHQARRVAERRREAGGGRPAR